MRDHWSTDEGMSLHEYTPPVSSPPVIEGCDHQLRAPRGGVQRRAPRAVERGGVGLAHPAPGARGELPAHAAAR